MLRYPASSSVRSLPCFPGSFSRLFIRLLMLSRTRLSTISASCFLAGTVNLTIQLILAQAPASHLPTPLFHLFLALQRLHGMKPLTPHLAKFLVSLPVPQAFQALYRVVQAMTCTC